MKPIDVAGTGAVASGDAWTRLPSPRTQRLHQSWIVEHEHKDATAPFAGQLAGQAASVPAFSVTIIADGSLVVVLGIEGCVRREEEHQCFEEGNERRDERPEEQQVEDAQAGVAKVEVVRTGTTEEERKQPRRDP